MFLEVFKECSIDTIKLLPILFITYLIMELIERYGEEKTNAMISKAGHMGPLIGGVVGIVPQCGLSAAGAGLFSGGVITLGTMIAIFLSTSDEMLPIFLSAKVSGTFIIKVLLVKCVIAVVSGFAVDTAFRMISRRDSYKAKKHELHDHDAGEEENESLILCTLIHTLKVTVIILVVTLVINLGIEIIGKHALAGFIGNRPFLGVFLSGIVGLIPSCGSSVILTQLYLEGLLGIGQMLAGLLVNAGVGMVVLFQSNRHHLSENLKIVGCMYVLGVAWGLLLVLLGFTL